MAGFGELLATTHDVCVLVPVHPGFGGTHRPYGLVGIPVLAGLYNGLIELLGLKDVTVIGDSIGGWITAEVALLRSPRVSGIVLIDAVGIEVPGHPVADFFAMTMTPAHPGEDDVMDRTEPKLSTDLQARPSRWPPAPIKASFWRQRGVWPGPGTGYISPSAAASADGPPPRPPARFLELDVTSRESVRHAAGGVERAEGHPDVLVNKPASPARCATTRTTTEPAT